MFASYRYPHFEFYAMPKIKLKFNLSTIVIDIPDAETTGGETDYDVLRRKVREATGVLESRQKLIMKGKQLDPTWRAGEARASTVLLLEQATGGTYGSRVAPTSTQSRGQVLQRTMLKAKAAIRNAVSPAAVRQETLEERVGAAAKLGSLSRNGIDAGNIPTGSFDRRLSRVELTGCRNFRADMLARWLSSPQLRASLKKLVINSCQLKDDHLIFQAIEGLEQLTHLELKGNCLNSLTVVPVGRLTVLDLSNNALTDCGRVPLDAETVVLSGNRIRTLDLGVLNAAKVVVAAGAGVETVITAPSTSTSTPNGIKVLDVRGNRNLKRLPDGFFRELGSLVQLELSHTAVEERDLREMEGWADFEQRRRKRKEKAHLFVREYTLS